MNKKTPHKYDDVLHRLISNNNIQIYINEKRAAGVQSLRLHADISFNSALIRASVVQIDGFSERSIDGSGLTGIVTHTHQGNNTLEINPNMEEGFVLHAIEDDGEFISIYLRTIITK